MSVSRIYQSTPLEVNTHCRLDAKATHHLAHVLRAQVGDSIILFNGTGGEYAAQISRMDKKGIEVKVLAFTAREVEAPVAIHLAQGIARGEKMDFIVQKAVELGVKSITPLITARCNVRLAAERSEKRWTHWQAIAQGACEQCGRNYVPEIFMPKPLEEWLEDAKADLSFVLTPHTKNKFHAEEDRKINSIQILIGPEGGLDEKEIELASKHGFLPLLLGPRILRTETATIAALTTLQVLYGDLN